MNLKVTILQVVALDGLARAKSIANSISTMVRTGRIYTRFTIYRDYRACQCCVDIVQKYRERGTGSENFWEIRPCCCYTMNLKE